LEGIASLLDELRAIDGLTEKRPGVFYRGSRAWVHFHEDGDDIYADARMTARADFERTRVTTKTEQRKLVAAVRRSVR
jgi:hypothetical protein